MYSLPDTKFGRGGGAAVAVVVVVVWNFGAGGPPATVVVVLPRRRSFGDDFNVGRCVAAAIAVVGAGVGSSPDLDRNTACWCCGCVGCILYCIRMRADAELVVCNEIFTSKEVLLLFSWWVGCLRLLRLWDDEERSCGNVLFDDEVEAVVAPALDDETLRGNEEHAAFPSPPPLPMPSPWLRCRFIRDHKLFVITGGSDGGLT